MPCAARGLMRFGEYKLNTSHWAGKLVKDSYLAIKQGKHKHDQLLWFWNVGFFATLLL